MKPHVIFPCNAKLLSWDCFFLLTCCCCGCCRCFENSRKSWLSRHRCVAIQWTETEIIMIIDEKKGGKQCIYQHLHWFDWQIREGNPNLNIVCCLKLRVLWFLIGLSLCLFFHLILIHFCFNIKRLKRTRCCVVGGSGSFT